MMPMTVVQNDLPLIAAQMESNIPKALLQTAEWITSDVKRQMRMPKRGRTYKRGNITRAVKMGGRAYKKWKGSGAKGTYAGGKVTFTVGAKVHRASAPGEAPAVDTGNLINSLGAELVSQSKAVAYSTSEIAVNLELGTRKIAPRPAFVPSAFRAVEQLWKLMAKALNNGK